MKPMDQAIQALTDAGIPTALYSRAPAGKHIFTIGIGDRFKKTERVCIWPGNVTLAAVNIDKAQRQAIFNVYEETLYLTATANDITQWQHAKIDDHFEYMFTHYLNVRVPDESKYVGCEKLSNTRYKITVEIPASTRSFLIGYDTDLIKDSIFISMLPEVVGCVNDAHEVLRPPNVPKDTLRQGEFFFIPDNDAAPLFKVMVLHNSRLERRRNSTPMLDVDRKSVV